MSSPYEFLASWGAKKRLSNNVAGYARVATVTNLCPSPSRAQILWFEEVPRSLVRQKFDHRMEKEEITQR